MGAVGILLHCCLAVPASWLCRGCVPARARRAVPPAWHSVYASSKPPWCQPWTITLTGTVAMVGSWALFPSFPGSIVAVGVSGAVSLWWWVFLVAYPQATLRYAEADERRAAGGGEGRS